MARKNFGLKNFFLSFAIVVIAIYVFQNFKSSADFMVAENGILEDVIKAEGIIVKDEKVYNATLDGSVIYYYEEGTKMKQGQLVADINTNADAESVNGQIAEIQAAIDNLENSGEQSELKVNFTAYQNEIQESILNNDLQNMYNIVGQVNNKGVFYNDTYADYSVSQLKEMKNNIMNSVSTNKVPYYSDRAGIISYKTDGLEDVYKFENVMDMTPSSTVKRDYSFKDKNNNVKKIFCIEYYTYIKAFSASGKN